MRAGLPEGEEWSEEKLAIVKEHAKKVAASRTPEQVLHNQELSKKYRMQQFTQELFVPYKEALALKELGFDEPCFGYYNNDNQFTFFVDVRSCNTNSEFGFHPTAPTYSQAFKWFREKHNLFGAMYQDGDEENVYVFRVFDTYYPHQTRGGDGEYTYEEAELACLRKLIEIVKSKS